MIEVEANLSFRQVKRGDRLQVDIHDPVVAGLIQAGYYKIVWKDVHELADPGDPHRSGVVPGSGVGLGAVPPPAAEAGEEVTDGAGEHRPEQEDSVRAPSNRAAGKKNV